MLITKELLTEKLGFAEKGEREHRVLAEQFAGGAEFIRFLLGVVDLPDPAETPLPALKIVPADPVDESTPS